MVYHAQQASIPNGYYRHYPIINRTQPSTAQHFQCNNINNNNDNSQDMLNYPNHVQIHPYHQHQGQHYSLHYSSAAPPFSVHDNHHPSFYFNNGQAIESFQTCTNSCNRLLKRDTQSCDDLCSSADMPHGKLHFL